MLSEPYTGRPAVSASAAKAISVPRAQQSPLPRGGASGSGASGTPAQPQVRSLVVSGDPLVGATLVAQASFIDAAEASSAFVWHRSTQPGHTLSRTASYLVTSDDLGQELVVHVTPVSDTGEIGDPMRASPSSPIALPGNVHSWLREWVEMGQRAFPNCKEGDKERQVHFTHEKIKLKDKSGKTLAKSDGYAAVSVRLDAESPASFTLSIGGRRGVHEFVLTAPQGTRDLIALTLMSFTDVASLERMPVLATSASSHLSSIGSLALSAPQISPNSSRTSEQVSLADVDEAVRGAGTSDRRSRISAAGRKVFDSRRLGARVGLARLHR